MASFDLPTLRALTLLQRTVARSVALVSINNEPATHVMKRCRMALVGHRRTKARGITDTLSVMAT
jgi:hypothetical protein